MKIIQSINHENQLFIEIMEEVKLEKIGKKPSLKLHFKHIEEERLFPLDTILQKKEDSLAVIVGKASILLPYVFFREIKEGKVSVWVELFEEGKREFLGELFVLEARYFSREKWKEKKEPSFFLFALSPLFIPFALGLSFFERNRGRNMMIAANHHIKEWTGVSFSIREFKTSYFKKQYQKYASCQVKTNQVLFLSERRMEEGGNLSLIFHALREKNLEIRSFLVEKTVDKLSFSELKESARLIGEASLIILEDFYPQLHALSLRKETRVIQLWHACGAFKTFGFSRLFKNGGPNEDSPNHRNYDKVFVSAEDMVPYYSEAFAISEKNVLPLGVPRTDIFFEEAYKRRIREKLLTQFPTFLGKRILLFAPTFRGLGNKDAFYPRDAFSVEEFMKDLPEDVILIIKQHPFVKQSIPIPAGYEERVFDLSKGISINDLLFVTDLLITDYSSSVFEAVLLNLSMIFYVFDEESYLAERDIYGDFDSFIPGAKVKSMGALKKGVNDFLQGERSVSYDLEGFQKRYLSALDGRSTERITNYILGLTEEEGE